MGFHVMADLVVAPGGVSFAMWLTSMRLWVDWSFMSCYDDVDITLYAVLYK